MKISFRIWLTFSRFALQTAEIDVKERVVAPRNLTAAFENGEMLNSFSGKLKTPEPTKSRCGMNMYSSSLSVLAFMNLPQRGKSMHRPLAH